MNKKIKLRKEADKLWYQAYIKNKCEVCGSDGTMQGHHYFPKSSYNYLRYEKENCITLCIGCHFKHHTKGDPLIHEAIYKKRKKDIDKLKKIKRPIGSYLTQNWYQNNIEKLKDLTTD